ncbi:MAG: hypothetical protein ACOC1F_07045 [Myxococcota bacterium]
MSTTLVPIVDASRVATTILAKKLLDEAERHATGRKPGVMVPNELPHKSASGSGDAGRWLRPVDGSYATRA